jgi:FlaA1/EpsC-like NDP-sugar epimerase
VEEVLRRYRPSAIYHAAAYKHVPLMEAHVCEAVENNVLGTHNLAEAAAASGVQHFVMISSDKAVRPSSIMGATKRIAELLLLGLQGGRTNYLSVRFGNVIGSSGSVIPIFQEQIAAGGPVTVTHPEMSRYFIPLTEACQLVLQASAMNGDGGIFVLDMGQPVRIVDLARSFIREVGLRPDIDIQIQFTGARPGEKLSEELVNLQEGTIPTDRDRIRMVKSDIGSTDAGEWLSSGLIDSLREICQERDTARLIALMQEIVPEYSPSDGLQQYAFAPGSYPADR